MPPSLVLLPGMDGTGDMFRPLLDAFGGTLSSVVVSYPSTEPLRYAELVALVRESLPTNRPYVLLGESFSGPIAVTLAAERPGGLIGLILCASFVSNPTPLLRPLRILLDFLPIQVALRTLGPGRLFGRSETPELRRLFFEAAKQVSTPVLRTRIREALNVDVSPLLGSVDVPVMYLQATEDRLLTQAVADHFLRAAPKAKLVRIAAPHGVLQCVPHEAARLIAEFLRSVSQVAHG
jgi:pimeloyl-[acyl-carrier protein] methyl ester esterase